MAGALYSAKPSLSSGCRMLLVQLWTAGSPEGSFSHIFVDEAGHAEEPLLVCAMAGHAKGDGSTRVVLAGVYVGVGPAAIGLVSHLRKHNLTPAYPPRVPMMTMQETPCSSAR